MENVPFGSATTLPNSQDSLSGDAAIVTRGLVKRFGRRTTLDHLDITVPRGCVYALLGRNGVGKSTLMQLLMGMLDPTEGTINVLGLNPIREGVALKQRLGYIPERMPMYDWMTVGQTLGFVSNIYSHWSPELEDQLAKKFRLQRDQKVGVLSRGNRALLSLVIAMAHQPELVLLDECTSGMDAIARREFERSVIDALSGTGRTVLFSGHQIDEMERICDWVGIIHNGKMLLEQPLDVVKNSVFGVRIKSTANFGESLPGLKILASQKSGGEQFVTVQSEFSADYESTARTLPEILEIVSLSLEDIFVALVDFEDAR